MEHKFRLGVTVRDRITGLTGIAVARIEYINGCIQYGIRCKLDKDGKVPDSQYIDQGHLEQVDEGIFIESRDIGAEDSPKEKRGIL